MGTDDALEPMPGKAARCAEAGFANRADITEQRSREFNHMLAGANAHHAPKAHHRGQGRS